MKDISTIEGWRDFQATLQGRTPASALLRNAGGTHCLALEGNHLTIGVRSVVCLGRLRDESASVANTLRDYLGMPELTVAIVNAPNAQYLTDAEKAEQEREEAESKRKYEEAEAKARAKRERAREQRRRDDSRIPARLWQTHKLEDFQVMPGNKAEFEAACYFACLHDDLSDFTEDEMESWDAHHFLTFVGEPGRGKTRLAIGVGIRNGGTARYWQVQDLLDTLRGTFSKATSPRQIPKPDEYTDPEDIDLRRGNADRHSFEGIMEDLKKCDLLILDDFGAQHSTEWAEAEIDHIVDYRYMEGNPTIFTTNLSPDELQPRIASRLVEGTIVTLTGPDMRPLLAKRREAARRKVAEKVTV